ncbi:hypothetical protein F7230_04345 [Corynebacterium sp. 320]|uniref:hypothetical protein n=1 Tax=Corynebacterium TaxID=1716 RepID=UPI00125CCD82|nr:MULTISPECIES: hypothetical protein [Corynebacterium]KAB1504317.1 hypothetical protein F7230_04345 [Corynebacterium sp. 320]KAB1552583.1 hypothetical protein F7233_02245 [Corynebacterium sp. 321]KAB1554199.1 hypothetical protein F7232_04340 [Corynebacterium sp. 319]KAB3528453.1 hypothetical protein F8354_04345 [Corynebacterium sp. 250]KAB3540057.1 hypothetical protein F8390_01990 [Corynebacterium sp. 366]
MRPWKKLTATTSCLLLTATLVTPGIATAADTAADTNSTTAATTSPETTADQQALVDELEQGFETLFSEVVIEDEFGNWHADPAAAARHGISTDDAQTLADFMNAPVPGDTSFRGWASYGECIATGVLGSPISTSDAIEIAHLVQGKQFRKAAEKILGMAALSGASAALTYGFSALGGPAGLAASIAILAGKCALNEKLP